MKNKVWIDIITPKQVMFFERVIEQLEELGHDTLLTTRDYDETNRLLNKRNIHAISLGKHGGSTLEGKIDASLERMEKLKELALEEKPNLSMALSSPEMARVAFGLNIPFVCLNDIPEAEAVCRLTVPLCDLLITPKVVPKKSYYKYGIDENRIVQYDAQDPVAWLKNFKPDEKVIEKLGVEKSRPIITFRTEESYAAYLEGKKNNNVLEILNESVEKIDASMILVPRYKEERDLLREKFGERIIIPEDALDTQSLIYYSNALVCGGGTMLVEAALLGTRALACRPLTSIYEEYIMEKGLAEKYKNYEQAISFLEESLDKNFALQKENAKKFVQEQEDPVEIIVAEIKKIFEEGAYKKWSM